ncbi:MAG: thioredoxin family protein [Actinobacteria bacterium]|nr:thioredoxin family protein [Actinomycetota bacterium]
MKIKLFWKENCSRCPSAKNLLQNYSNVDYCNTGEVDGLSEAAYYGVMSTPSILLIEGEEVIRSWTGEAPTRQELEEWIEGRVEV